MIRGNQVSYMTQQWRMAILGRSGIAANSGKNLHAIMDANKQAYKTQRNTFTSLRRKATKQHFARKTADTKNPRDFWSTFRPFLHTKSEQAYDITSKENDRIISDKKKNCQSA